MAEKWNKGLLLALTSLPRFEWEKSEGQDAAEEPRVFPFPAQS